MILDYPGLQLINGNNLFFFTDIFKYQLILIHLNQWISEGDRITNISQRITADNWQIITGEAKDDNLRAFKIETVEWFKIKAVLLSRQHQSKK